MEKARERGIEQISPQTAAILGGVFVGQPPDQITLNILELANRYKYIQQINEFSCWQAVKKGKDIFYISDDEFYENNGGDPINLLANALDIMGLPYEPVIIESADSSHFSNIVLRKGETELSFDDLSSGEKRLCFIAFSLYRSWGELDFPELLLFDEPDVGLHPSMSMQMLKVIEGSLLPELKAGVIITTHSPSTVAVAHECNVFSMNFDTRRPESVEIDDAIQTLSFGVPNFSISRKNDRQFFVESKIDEYVYSEIDRLLRMKFGSEFFNLKPCYYISTNRSWRDGSCDEVLDFTRRIRTSGVDSVCGIIDFDGENIEEDGIFIIGGGVRYSIENYVLEPVVIAGLMLHSKNDQAADIFGVKSLEGLTFPEIGNLSDENISNISLEICKMIRGKILALNSIGGKIKPDWKYVSEPAMISVENMSNQAYQLPQWYFKINGHELEDHILKTFPELNSFCHEGLVGSAMKHVFKSYKELISIDFKHFLTKITS